MIEINSGTGRHGLRTFSGLLNQGYCNPADNGFEVQTAIKSGGMAAISPHLAVAVAERILVAFRCVEARVVRPTKTIHTGHLSSCKEQVFQFIG